MWLVRLALRRPYTFTITAMLIVLLGDRHHRADVHGHFSENQHSGGQRHLALYRPVVGGDGRPHGLVPSARCRPRSTTSSISSRRAQRRRRGEGLSSPDGRTSRPAWRRSSAICQTMLVILPPGANPPLILQYTASTVPDPAARAVQQDACPSSELYDSANNFIRTQLATVQGAVPLIPYGGKARQVMVDIDPKALQAKNLGPQDVVDALSQNLILPTGTVKIGDARIRRARSTAARESSRAERPAGAHRSAGPRSTSATWRTCATVSSRRSTSCRRTASARVAAHHPQVRASPRRWTSSTA